MPKVFSWLRSRKRWLAFFIGGVLLSTASEAATVLRYSETRTFEARDRSAERDREISIWLDSARARYDGYPETLLLNTDESRLVILHPEDEAYSVVDHPFRLESQAKTDLEQRRIESISTYINPRIELVDSGETSTVGPWAARKFKVLVHDRGLEVEITVWMSEEPAVDEDLYRRLMRDHYASSPLDRLWAEKILQLEGIPVLQEEVFRHAGGIRIGERTRTRTLRLLSVEEQTPPPGFYHAPPGHEETPFDLSRYMGVPR